MATLLLVVIYTAYIGLGVPDSLFGAAWPAIYPEFGIPVSLASIVSVSCTTGTITSSFLSARLIRRFGTARVTAVSTTMTALALLGFALSGNLLCLILSAIPLGLGAGAIDAAQNNYVALHYGANHMNFLHCFYGVGVMAGPYLMSLGIESGDWRNGYFMAFAIQAVIAVIMILALPLWNRAHPEKKEEEGEAAVDISVGALAKMPAVRATWLVFILSCGIESITINWGSTFLVQSRGLTPEAAARVTILYYLGFTLARFLSGVVAKWISSWTLIRIGLVALTVSAVLLLLPFDSLALSAVGLFLVGFGVGPIYPNLTYLTPRHFGEELSQAVIGSQMAFAYVGILFLPILLGVLLGYVGSFVFPIYYAVIFAGLLASTVYLMRTVGRSLK